MPNRIPSRFLAPLLSIGVALWLTAQSVSSNQAGQELYEADFQKLHQELQPPKDEPWRTIPWQMSLLEARTQGAKEKKPLVVRVRAGHPLGCV